MFGVLIKAHSSRGAGFDTWSVQWADKKTVLTSRIHDVEEAIQSSDPFFPFTFERIRANVYFELNKANFALVLNGGSHPTDPNYNLVVPSYVWEAVTQLPVTPGFPFSFGGVKTGSYDDFTIVDHPSPRRTWSHGH